jgi:hypothetical protein
MGVPVMLVTEMERSDIDARRNAVNSPGTEKPKKRELCCSAVTEPSFGGASGNHCPAVNPWKARNRYLYIERAAVQRAERHR